MSAHWYHFRIVVPVRRRDDAIGRVYDEIDVLLASALPNVAPDVHCSRRARQYHFEIRAVVKQPWAFLGVVSAIGQICNAEPMVSAICLLVGADGLVPCRERCAERVGGAS